MKIIVMKLKTQIVMKLEKLNCNETKNSNSDKKTQFQIVKKIEKIKM